MLHAEKKILLMTEVNRAAPVAETDVGIDLYVTAGEGFTGAVKQRYTDFLVNEIDPRGAVVRLVDLGPLPEAAAEEQEPEPEKEEAVDTALTEEGRASLLALFTAEEVVQMEAVLTTQQPFTSTTTFDDKARRTAVHNAIRTAFHGKLDSLTTPAQQIGVAVSTGRRLKRRKRMPGGPTNYGLGAAKEFLHFTVYKENKDTMQVALMLTRFLGVQLLQVRYAGTKDRRGVTVQRMCVRRVRAERVVGLNKALKGIRLGGMHFEDTGLLLGDLKGNQFVVTLKEVKGAERVAERLAALEKHGFINYFGMQRFGTFSVLTHEVGVPLLKGEWGAAVALVLSQQQHVTPDLVEARKIWAETGDAAAALEKMPRHCTAELALLRALSHKPHGPQSEGTYFDALMQVPRNLRVMYGHAYQSYVWNRVASARMRLHGAAVVAGDLVVDTAAGEAIVPTEGEDVAVEAYTRARAVTPAEVAEGKFSIFDVVLPTPGFDIVYPLCPGVEEVYVEVMGADGLDPHSMARRVREFLLAGLYRHLLGRPTDVLCVTRPYQEETDQLVHTDLEILEAAKRGEVLPVVPSANPDGTPFVGDKTAAIVTLLLGVSAYATVALRELMGAPSGSDHK